MKKGMKFLLEDVTFSRDSNSVDQQIDDVIHRAERVAVQVAMKSGRDNVEESSSVLSMKFLFEEDEEKKPEPPSIDVGSFANEIIRCLMMYEKVMDVPDIIDIPSVIVSRSSDFLKTKYGDEIQKQFYEILKDDQVASKMLSDVNVDTPSGPVNQPLAVGAGGGGGGAA
jgi:hypothetical protein